MTISDQDEGRHQPDDRERWQENCYLLGWDPEGRSGFLVHVERFPRRGEVDVRVVAVAGGRIGSAAVVAPIDDAVAFGVPSCRVEVVEPFRRLDVVADVQGRVGPGPSGVLALGGGDVPVRLDLRLEADLPPIDWAEALAGFPVAGTERDHYEVAHRWAGTISVGDRRVAARGLAVRDHTWGAREYDRFSTAMWFPACFDDARAYVSGVVVELDGTWHGIGIAADEDGVAAAAAVDFAADGPLAIGGYRAASVGFEPAGRARVEVAATTDLHLPVHYPGFTAGHLCNEAYSHVRWGERRGFGTIELNTELAPDVLAEVLAASEP